MLGSTAERGILRRVLHEGAAGDGRHPSRFERAFGMSTSCDTQESAPAFQLGEHTDIRCNVSGGRLTVSAPLPDCPIRCPRFEAIGAVGRSSPAAPGRSHAVPASRASSARRWSASPRCRTDQRRTRGLPPKRRAAAASHSRMNAARRRRTSTAQSAQLAGLQPSCRHRDTAHSMQRDPAVIIWSGVPSATPPGVANGRLGTRAAHPHNKAIGATIRNILAASPAADKIMALPRSRQLSAACGRDRTRSGWPRAATTASRVAPADDM